MHITAHQILAQLDRAWEEGNFPTMVSDGYYWLYGKARLSSYLTSQEWMIIIQLFTYDLRMADFDVKVYGYGNRLRQYGIQPPAGHRTEGSIAGRIARALRPLIGNVPHPPPASDRPGTHTLSGGKEDWCPDPHHFAVRTHDQVREFHPSVREYEACGIKLDVPISDDHCTDDLMHVTHFLADTLTPDELFLSDDALAQVLERTEMPGSFLLLEDWCNPGIADVHKPSESPSIAQLAIALAAGRADLYTCPVSSLNTHWSYWGYMPPSSI